MMAGETSSIDVRISNHGTEIIPEVEEEISILSGGSKGDIQGGATGGGPESGQGDQAGSQTYEDGLEVGGRQDQEAHQAPKVGPHCKFEDCPNDIAVRGWCSKHYTRWRRHGDPSFVTPHSIYHPVNYCSTGCGRPCKGQGYCDLHYYRYVTSPVTSRTSRFCVHPEGCRNRIPKPLIVCRHHEVNGKNTNRRR